jgi:hypothetical protein
MPLDGTDLFENPTLAKLGRVERLLATKQHWCKGRLRDANGRRCLIEAMTAVDGRQELTRPIFRAVREISGRRYWRIESFNDDPRTTHQDVLRVLRRARENIIIGTAASREPQPWRSKWVEALSILLPGSPPATGAALCPISEQERRATGGSDAGRSAPGGDYLRPPAIRETSDAPW